MSRPDYPMSIARDRFGTWLHVTGLSLREVVAALPHCFEAEAFLVYDDEQLDYATSDGVEAKRRAGLSRLKLTEEIARLDATAFWNTTEPLFENPTAAVWPADCLDGMIEAQGSPGGCFGVTPLSRQAAADLPEDFAYEHPSNVGARFSFLSTDDHATSVFVADEADLRILVRHVVAKALGAPAGQTDGLDDVVDALLPLLDEGVDIRARDDLPDGAPVQAALVAVGQWTLGSQWPLLWRDVPVCEIAWNGRRWTLSEVRREPGRRHVTPVRLIGELFHGTGYLTRFAVIVGLPLAAAALAWLMTGWIGGVLALIAAVLLWPRFVLGMDWHGLRRRRKDERELRGKYE